MFIELDRTGSVDGLKNAIEKLQSMGEVKSIMVLASEENGFDKISIDSVLKNVKLPIFGGIFPEIIYSEEKIKIGTIIVGIESEPDITIVPDLSNPRINYENILQDNIESVKQTKTMFVFCDGFAKRIGALIQALNNILGITFNYLGGGCGSMKAFKSTPSVISNDGLIQDCAILAQFNIESGVGVAHGWNTIKGPFKVTEVDRNTIITLDWIPAFEVYRHVVEKRSNKKFTKDNFFQLAKSFPFGINKMGTEKVVRDPFLLGDQNSLVCVGEIPHDCFIDILTGNSESLIRAAGKAVDLAEKSYKGEEPLKTTILFDCISRTLFLEERFQDEISLVSEGDTPVIGALTIGEIANTGRKFLDFYNKTVVVGVLAE